MGKEDLPTEGYYLIKKKERNGLDIQAKRELPVLTQTDKSSTWKMKWKCRDSYSE